MVDEDFLPRLSHDFGGQLPYLSIWGLLASLAFNARAHPVGDIGLEVWCPEKLLDAGKSFIDAKVCCRGGFMIIRKEEVKKLGWHYDPGFGLVGFTV